MKVRTVFFTSEFDGVVSTIQAVTNDYFLSERITHSIYVNQISDSVKTNQCDTFSMLV